MPAAFSTGDVARRLSLSAETVRRRWPQWRDRLGFPAPIGLGPRSLLRWDERQVEAWIAAGGQAPDGNPQQAEPDWSAIAAARGAALDAGQDPDTPQQETAQ